jgi:hypothetical protein
VKTCGQGVKAKIIAGAFAKDGHDRECVVCRARQFSDEPYLRPVRSLNPKTKEKKMHTVQTTHIQRLIKNALEIAEKVDGHEAAELVRDIGPAQYRADQNPESELLVPRVEYALCKAVSDLRHAADELDAERLSCYGWQQV